MYDTGTLLEVLKVQKSPKPFWLEKFFTQQINFDTEKIEFDRVSEEYRRLAPFVAPNVQGKVMTLEGYDTVSFKPAYVKPKHIVDIDKPFIRRPGEAIHSGSLTPQQRKDAVVADILKRHKDMHTMTREWMAAQAIITGKVTVEGENYPTVTVDFKRDASLTQVLAGGAKWDVVPADAAAAIAQGEAMLADIYDARATSNALCGAVIRDVVFGRDAWALFSRNSHIKSLLSNQVRGSDSNFTALTDGFEDTVEYLGTLTGVNGSGLVRMWLYSGKFADANGVLQDMMDPATVVGVDGATLQGFRCFGAIKDGSAGFQPLDMFPKNWEDQDPWNEYLMTQSAPLMVPKQPNASFSIKVK